MKIITYIALSLVFASGLNAEPARAPESLTWKNFDQVADYVRLKPGDLNYQKVTWHSTVIDGQREAQTQDKPLLLWLYFGDPRANC
ncbi:MAG: hypothetical protein AB8F34_03910 [Akkermansiaceae bacterium]